jgi:hypothetical protein
MFNNWAWRFAAKCSCPRKASGMSQAILSAEQGRELHVESAISEEVSSARGYRTITDTKELAALGFAPKQQLTPGLLMPGHGPDGSNGFCAYKPDYPRQARNNKGELTDKVIKYEIPAGASMRLDVPPVCRPMLADPSIPLWMTEGVKKADALASHGFCAACLYGVWNFKGQNAFSGLTVLADFDFIAWNGRDVRIVFDSDVTIKPEVRKALERLTEILQRKGAHVSAVYLPGGRDNKVGVDDFLREHTKEELEALVDAPRPEPQPAPPIIELMDAPPLSLRRPSALVDNKAYAAAWPYVKTTCTETKDQKTGQIIKHDPPLVTQEQRLIVVRSDGATFGEGGKYQLTELGFNVLLPEIPPQEKLWRAFAVKAYVQGQRPDPASVFHRIADVVDRFIDFDKSTASQREMCEFIACYIMASWFLDAFNIAGFVWPNGEKGSGKTQLLTIIAALGYLGQVILAGGSYASLRDLADYGAMLCFDDAENLSDPKQSDPDKQTLLLAGNRRGNSVPVKEPVPGERTWRTRYVSTFCPRAFSAIRIPSGALKSRTIVIPLIRTPDRRRANADPLDETLWPHDRRQLVDDLWALGLAHLAELPAYDRLVGQEAALVGRNFEPWRALLGVALWLDENGVTGLWQRMDSLSERYQAEQETFESGDLTALVIRALWKRFEQSCAIVPSTSLEIPVFVTTKEVTEAVKEIATEIEADIDLEKVTSRVIGRILSKLRLPKARSDGGKGRGWNVIGADLQKRLAAFGLADSQKVMAQTAHDGTTAQVDGTAETPDERAEREAILAGHISEEVRLGPALWRNQDHDQPITITGVMGRDDKGRLYVSIAEGSTGAPFDEIEYEEVTYIPPSMSDEEYARQHQQAHSNGKPLTHGFELKEVEGVLVWLRSTDQFKLPPGLAPATFEAARRRIEKSHHTSPQEASRIAVEEFQAAERV